MWECQKGWRQISYQIFLMVCCWQLIENSQSNWNLDSLPLFHIQGHTSFRYKGCNANWSFTSQNGQMKILEIYWTCLYLFSTACLIDWDKKLCCWKKRTCCRGEDLGSTSILGEFGYSQLPHTWNSHVSNFVWFCLMLFHDFKK